MPGAAFGHEDKSLDEQPSSSTTATEPEPQRLWWGGEINPISINAQLLAEEARKETFRVLFKASLAEFFAMFLFVYVSCGAASSTVHFEEADHTNTVIAMAFGFTIIALAFTFGHISGAHINTAVTFSFFLQRKVTLKRLICFAIAHFLGALVAGGFMRLTFPGAWNKSCYAANSLNYDNAVTPGQAFFIEMLLTGYLLLVVNSATDASKSNTTLVPLAIGLAVFCAHMVAIPIDGTSINPTRSFASAIAASNLAECPDVWTHHWIFWVAPMLGGAIGGLTYEYGFNAERGHTLLSMYQKKKGGQEEQ